MFFLILFQDKKNWYFFQRKKNCYFFSKKGFSPLSMEKWYFFPKIIDGPRKFRGFLSGISFSAGFFGIFFREERIGTFSGKKGLLLYSTKKGFVLFFQGKKWYFYPKVIHEPREFREFFFLRFLYQQAFFGTFSRNK